MGDYADVVGFGQRGDFLGAGDAAAHAHVGADELDGATPEQHLELENRV